jgi:hypothetical protein
MPNIGSILLTVVSYFIAFSIITDKFNQLEEKKESIHLSLVDWSNRWSVANIIKVKEDFQEQFLTKGLALQIYKLLITKKIVFKFLFAIKSFTTEQLMTFFSSWYT